MCSFLKTILILLSIFQLIASMLVQMSEPHIKVFDNGNISLICRTEQPNNLTDELTLSVRARMVLTFLQMPRGGGMHQVHGVLHCDPKRTKCESEFNLAVDCIIAQINISQPLDTLESACQLVDDQVCSHEWLKTHRFDCVALGTITVIKGPKLGERCIHRNRTIDQLLPCGDHQFCNTVYGVCECMTNYEQGQQRKCVPRYPEDEELLPTPKQNAEDHQLLDPLSSTTVTPTSEITTIKISVAGLPTLSSDDNKDKTPANNSNNRKTSKALVIFLLIVAILLCIALAVVIIWSYSRSRSLTANVSN